MTSRLAAALDRAIALAPGPARALIGVLERVSAGRFGHWLADHGHLPERVRVTHPHGSFDLIMGTPTDHVATTVWLRGPTAYEAPLPGLLAALPLRGRTAVVVGASSGYYALLLASSGVPVRAYEPFPPAFARVRENVRVNGLDAVVDLSPAAVGDAHGVARLFVPVPGAEHWPLEMSASLDPTFKAAHAEAIDVSVVTLDEDVAGDVGLLFVDAEGVELSVLRGAADLVARCRPVVVVEVTDGEVAEARELVRAWGYRAAEIVEDGLLLQDQLREPRASGVVDRSATRRRFWTSVLLPPEAVADLTGALRRAGWVLHAEG